MGAGTSPLRFSSFLEHSLYETNKAYSIFPTPHFSQSYLNNQNWYINLVVLCNIRKTFFFFLPEAAIHLGISVFSSPEGQLTIQETCTVLTPALVAPQTWPAGSGGGYPKCILKRREIKKQALL